MLCGTPCIPNIPRAGNRSACDAPASRKAETGSPCNLRRTSGEQPLIFQHSAFSIGDFSLFASGLPALIQLAQVKRRQHRNKQRNREADSQPKAIARYMLMVCIILDPNKFD